MAHEMSLEEVQKHIRVYLLVFGALAVLTVVTVAVSYVHIPFYPALIVALIIASVKAGLVAAYFMHLVGEKQVIMWVLISAGVFLLALFVLFISSYADQEQLALITQAPILGHVA